MNKELRTIPAEFLPKKLMQKCDKTSILSERLEQYEDLINV